MALPVYGYPKRGYSSDEIVHNLLNPIFKEELLSETHPVSVEHNVSFVVDLTSLSDPNDVRADDLGSHRISMFHLHGQIWQYHLPYCE